MQVKCHLLLVQRIGSRVVIGTRGEKHAVFGTDVGTQRLHHRRGEGEANGSRTIVIFQQFVYGEGTVRLSPFKRRALQSHRIARLRAIRMAPERRPRRSIIKQASDTLVHSTESHLTLSQSSQRAFFHRYTRRSRRRQWGSAKRTAHRNTPATCTRFPTTDTSR